MKPPNCGRVSFPWSNTSEDEDRSVALQTCYVLQVRLVVSFTAWQIYPLEYFN